MAFLRGFAPAVVLRGRRCQSARIVVMLAWLLGSSSTTVAQGGPSPEYQVKAVFLFNLAQFIQWPARAFPDPGAPLIIGVLGDDPFGGYLDETLRGEKVNNRSLLLQRYRRPSEIRTCHVLF